MRLKRQPKQPFQDVRIIVLDGNMAQRSKEYWTLFEIIHGRLLPFLTESIRPGLLNSVFGLPEPETTQKGRAPSHNEKYWTEWLREFTEINTSMARLEQSLVYLSHYPKSRALRSHRLSEADWLRYHVEVYLHETYILYARLVRFMKKLNKLAVLRRDKTGLSAVEMLKRTVDSSLRKIVAVRTDHVHDTRFQDEELRNLDTLVLLTRHGNLRNLGPFRSNQFGIVLRKWRQQLRKNNNEIEKLCTFVL